MKIIAGQYKGRSLITPKDRRIRPTSARVREFIFSFLGLEIIDARVLDLFAGTGSMGIEALSRNAANVIFNDFSYRSVEIVRENLNKINCAAHIYKMSARHFIKFAVENNYCFDIVFCDPPYEYSSFETILKNLINILNRSIVVYESSSKSEIIHINEYEIIKTKFLGDTKIIFYRYNGQK